MRDTHEAGELLLVGDGDTDLVLDERDGGDHRHCRLPVHRGQRLVVGRGPSVDIILTNAAASRRAFELEISMTGEVLVRDLNSAGGTRVNNGRVQSARIRPRDYISVTSSTLLYFRQGEQRQLDLPVFALP